jgi:DNA-binding CsgD family transcriptional regulator/tetratricopeptide (TPR) repeat protein
LLSAAEQKALQRLSIFANGWMLEAAEAVCADADIRPAEVMDVLSNLVDKSLVMVDGSRGDRRYRLLETIRQYAAQKLAEAGEADAIRNRHLSYFRQWAEIGETHLTGPDQSGWLEQFDAEHDNLRAALEWSHTTKGRAEAGLRLARACGHFWRLRGYFSEGRARLAAALSQPGAPQRTEVHAWTLLWAANLAYMQSDYAATRTLAEEGLAVSRELGSAGRPGVARALDILGELATEVGDYETASDLLTEALAIYRELDERRGTADMLLQLGWAAMRSGQYDQAKDLLNESLPLFRELGEAALLGLVLAGLGELAIRQGLYEEANALLQESLALRRELGDRWGIAASLGSLGWAALRQHDFERTHEMLQQSLTIRREIGDQGGIAWCLEKLAEAFALQALAFPASYRRRANRRAVRLFGAAAALRNLLNSVIDPVDQPEYERFLKDLRRTLGSKAYETAWNEGDDRPLREIVDLALTPLLSPAEADSFSSAQAAKLKFGGLSSREREAANLIAQGKTNREIAEIMVVRVKTVETYVTRILNKLGFDSRVQIATWALEIGLTDMNTGG